MIVQDRDEQWELPGGKIQAGEDISNALQREIREELGDNAVIELGSVFHVWKRQPDPTRDFFLFLVGFRCAYKSGEITLSPEHKNFRWVTKDEASQLPFEDTYKETVKYYFGIYPH